VKVIVAGFDDRERAEAALAQLRAAGFDDDDIALVTGRDPAAADVPGQQDPRRGDSTLPVATFGTAAGAVVGGAMFGPAGAIVGGLVGGGFGAMLSGRGMTEDEIRDYESYLREGRYTLAVDAAPREAEAWRILKQAGADRLRERDD
jgi:hypothetical protein